MILDETVIIIDYDKLKRAGFSRLISSKRSYSSLELFSPVDIAKSVAITINGIELPSGRYDFRFIYDEKEKSLYMKFYSMYEHVDDVRIQIESTLDKSQLPLLVTFSTTDSENGKMCISTQDYYTR